jgi:hypothetical protein
MYFDISESTQGPQTTLGFLHVSIGDLRTFGDSNRALKDAIGEGLSTHHHDRVYDDSGGAERRVENLAQQVRRQGQLRADRE